MILVDTSVWVDHLRNTNSTLVALLDAQFILGHHWVTGELALGGLENRDEVIGLLGSLPQAEIARDDEVLFLISREKLNGAGIGYVDAQLLAATKLTPDTTLWTVDKRLAEVAARLKINFAAVSHP